MLTTSIVKTLACHTIVILLPSFRYICRQEYAAVSSGGILMQPYDAETRVEARAPIPQTLRQFVARRGPAVIDDLRRYLHMCLKAEELRQYGLRTHVRGHWQRWLVVIERIPHPQRSEKSLMTRTRRSVAFARRGQVHVASFPPRLRDPQRPPRKMTQRSSLGARRIPPLPWFV